MENTYNKRFFLSASISWEVKTGMYEHYVRKTNELVDRIEILLGKIRLAEINGDQEDLASFTNHLEILLAQYLQLKQHRKTG
jgi:hypothetical protein